MACARFQVDFGLVLLALHEEMNKDHVDGAGNPVQRYFAGKRDGMRMPSLNCGLKGNVVMSYTRLDR